MAFRNRPDWEELRDAGAAIKARDAAEAVHGRRKLDVFVVTA